MYHRWCTLLLCFFFKDLLVVLFSPRLYCTTCNTYNHKNGLQLEEEEEDDDEDDSVDAAVPAP